MVLDAEKSCLVIIDMQEKIFPKMNDSKLLLKNMKELIHIASILKVPTFMTEQNSSSLGSTIYEIRELVSGASVIDKTSFSAYNTEAFSNKLELLKNEGRTQVVIAGIEEHICVLQTAFHIKENGYTPFVATDCCSSREAYSRQMAEMRMMANEINLVTNDMIAFEWLKDCHNPKFKEVLEIIK